jgi:hypothetical protein
MTQERWFRGGDEATAFDWYRSARDLDVPVEIARALYARALQLAADAGPRRAEDLYLRLLRDAARAQHPAAASRAPGRQTRVIHEAKPLELPELAALGPGRWTRTLFERDAADASAPRVDDALLATQTSAANSEREPGRPSRLPVAMRERMEQAYGQAFDDVELHRDSAEVPAGQQAFARGRHIHFERGAFDPGSEHGEHIVAHELAHVAQQAQPEGHGRPATRAALEADAHQAALSALAGHAAMVRFAAPAQVALGFSHGASPEPAPGGAEPQGAQVAAPAARTAVPGFSGAAELREQLLAAAVRGRGAANALTAADPATAAATLRELRSTHVAGHAAPALQLVARASDGEATRVLGRGSDGAPLPDDIAARLGPHVGSEAASAARLHTDDLADLVAAAHHARAVTLGAEIYFARGEYAPGTERGDELLAHELTHVAQAQRGELARAAAKGLESGGTLDPSEAEADLRAKLAVIQLHPSDALPPPLAAPSGQPTSEGDRAAKIAAQQQRITLAGQPALPLAAAPAPAASSPQAPVVHPPPPMTAAPAPARTGNAYVDTFQAPPSKQATELWAKAAGEATTQEAADQSKFDSALPPMPVLLDGGKASDAKASGGGAAGQKQAPAAGVVPPAATPTPTPAAAPVTAGATAARAIQPTADKAQLKADGQKVIDNLPTSSPDVKTDPGPAPLTDLAGQADPVRTLGDQEHAVGEGAKALDDAKTRVVTGPGAAQVQPVKLDEKLKVPKEQAAGAMPALPPVDGMAKLKKWNLPSDVQASFDGVAKPKMDASLAQAKAKMTEAEGKRDADRTKAVTDAQDKVKQAHADADKQQQAKVAATRTQISNKQADTLVKQENEVKKLDQQSGDKKKGAVSKINDRIQSDQAKVETDYKTAQQQADDKKKQGEADAAKKKKEAEDKKKDESWWDKAADAVCDGIKAIADEIDHALEAIGKAIGDLLDAVKDAACKVIDAARDFVCAALTEFGDWLKSAVTALIGQVFPELAAELNRLIDQAVSAAKEAVNAIADGLKKAVTALCDGLKAAIDAAIAAFRAAVQAAATFAQALVTGDWSLVGKMILEGILKLLGIDPAAFYALIGKAEDSIEKIIENPGAFVGHLVDAVKLGFKQFGANFLTHLKNGVVQWLFGTFAEAGITLPQSFDVAGIFDLVCQVLGLTWPRLRPKVVKVIGEKNTERLEFVEKYVQALVTGGFSGLWGQIQQDMSGLWDMVIGGVKSWLMEKIVQQAIIKIATMWNPAGAIIQLIETAWNVYQWVRENAQRIFGLVQAVVDSVSNIVAGNIGGAANFIEASLAKLVPIAISLFADLIGLGGIAEKIKSVITKVQDTIDKAIDKLIDRVMGMFKGKDGGKDGKDGDHKDGKDGDHKDEPEVPKSLVEPATATIEGLSPAVAVAVDQAPPGSTVIYQAPDVDPKSVTKNLLATHKDAHLDKTSAQLTLPAIQPGALGSAQTLHQLGEILAHQTGVSSVELQRNGEGNAEIVGSINPRATFAQLAVNKRYVDAKNYYAIGSPNEAFAIEDITIAGAVVQGLKTTIGLEASQARKYLDEWVSTGKVREITSPHPPTKVYGFKPSPTPADLLVPKLHPEYAGWMSGCALVPIPAADADRDWDLLITGMRDNKPANFDAVAASLMRNMSVPAGKGALWSGGEDLSDYAKSQGCTTLEQQDFYKATKGLELVNDWSVAKKAWAGFSELYASQLRGKCHIYLRRLAAGSVLVDVELKKIDEMLRAGRVPGGLPIRYHAMEWGDDPHQKLTFPLPGYWRELDAAGNPLAAGAVLEQDKGPAGNAAGIAERRFKTAQAAKP